MKNPRTASLAAVLLSVLGAISSPLGVRSAQAEDAKGTLPGAKDTSYSVAASPHIPPDFDSRPVAVVGVTTEAFESETGWRISRVSVESHEAGAAAVRLTAYISHRDNPGVVLHRWETPEIALPATLKRSERVSLSVEMLSHRDLVLMRSDSVKDFQVDVAVTSVHFADGKTWSAEEISRLAYMQPDQFRNKAESAGLFKNASYTTGIAPADPQCYAQCVYHYVGNLPCPNRCLIWVYGCAACPGTTPCADCPRQRVCTCSQNYYDCSQPNPSPTKCTLGPYSTSCTVTYPCP